MFSSRLNWSFTENRLSTLLSQKRAAGETIYDLTLANPTQAEFDHRGDRILRALASPRALVYEPEPRGLLVAREAVAHYYRDRGYAIDAADLHLTASTSEAYAFIFKLLADPGDEVLIPQPSYPLFEFLAALESVKLVPYPLVYDEQTGWCLDRQKLEVSISTRTVTIVFVNPNNPTGSFIKNSELPFIAALCAEHQLAVICDEVFGDYRAVAGEPLVDSLIQQRSALTFVLNGLSKVCGLPQMKLGWIHVSGPPELKAQAQERLDFISDAFLSVSTPTQHATAALLQTRHEIQAQIRARIAENEKTLIELTASCRGARVLRREGGWYAVLEISGEIDEEEFCLQLLANKNVLVHPGYFFDFNRPGYLVISLLLPSHAFRFAVEAVAAELAGSLMI